MLLINLFIVVSYLLSIAYALPIPGGNLDQSLSSNRAVTEAKGIPLVNRQCEVQSELLYRGSSDFFRRAKQNQAKITFGKAARQDLDNLGLHGKERKKAKKYHKNIIKAHMLTIPSAHTAKVVRIAHIGGTTAGDPLHATVAFRKAAPSNRRLMSWHAQKKLNIQSTYTDAQGVTQTRGLHHVYPKKAQHKMPHSYAVAERIRAGLAPGVEIPHIA